MRLVLTPDWFLGNDVLIGIFSFLVLATFFILCLRNYKISKKKDFLYLGFGFLAISLAQLAAILTKLVLYYDTTFTQQIGEMVITYHVLSSVDILYQLGFFFNKFLMLLGFFIIYKIFNKSKKGDLFIVIYFIVLSALISSMIYHLYHLSLIMVLILIISNYYELYKKNNSENTRILIYAFSILLLSNCIFMFSGISSLFVLADVLELVSYIILLLLIIRILKFNN